MKKIIVWSVFALFSCLGPFAMASDIGKMELSLGAGAAVAASDPLAGVGFGGDVFLGYQAFGPISLGLQAGYFSVAAKGYPSTFQGQGSAGQFEIGPQVRAHLPLSDSFGILVLGGGGLAFYSNNILVVPTGATVSYPGISETDLFVSGGLGFEIGLGPATRLFLLGKADAVLTNNAIGNSEVSIPIEAGLDFSL